MNESKPTILEPLGWDVDRLLKLATGAAIVLTMCGYLVLSLREARFGYVSPNPFRPKVIAAGTLFVFFVGVPWLAGFGATQVSLPDNKGFWASLPCRLSGLSLATLFALFLLSPLRSLDLSVRTIYGRPILISFLGFVVGHAISALPFKNNILKTLENCLFVSTALIAFHWEEGALTDNATNDLFWWVMAIAAGSFLRKVLAPYSKAKSSDSAVNVILALTLLTGFSSHIYPQIPAGWGGAKPERVEILMGKDSFAPYLRVQSYLLEESDAGFYVADTPDGISQFVPRSQVSLLTFKNDRLGR